MPTPLTFIPTSVVTTPLTCSETLFCSESLLLGGDGLVFAPVS